MGEQCNVETVNAVRPSGEKTKVFKSDGTGMRITLGWKGWAILLTTLLAGGGSVTGLSFVTEGQLDEAIVKSEKKQTDRVEEVKTEVGKNRKSIESLVVTVQSVQEVQHVDVAHREARRVVEEELACGSNQKVCREKRIEKIERLRRINMKRLKEGRSTCDRLECSD
jgi:hypothetical protein